MSNQVTIPNDGRTFIIIDKQGNILRALIPGEEIIVQSGQIVCEAK